MSTVTQYIVKFLQDKGIKHVFGYPGLAICPLYDSLLDSDIEHVLVRNEQHAGHNANGYFRVSDQVTVCMATSGPGATNLITALSTAYTDSIPIIAITGQVSRDLLGTDSFQEADVFGCTQPFVKHSYMVMDPNDIAQVLEDAFYIANSGRKGPVLIDIPMDVQIEQVTTTVPVHNHVKGYHVPTEAETALLDSAIESIIKSERPLICVGGGVHLSGCRDQVVAFSEKFNIPAISTMMGIGTFPTMHPNYFGMLGSHGKPYANYANKQCDTLIIFGARVGNRAFTNPQGCGENTTVIHIDIDPAEIGKNVVAAIPVVGDISYVIKQLLEADIQKKHKPWMDALNEKKSKYKFDFDDRDSTLNPKGFVRMLSTMMEDDSIYCADVGQNQIWSSNNVVMRTGRFLTSGGMGTMGYSIPAAIGAKLAAPDKQVVAVCGDGSFQMSMSELATAVQFGANIKIVVMKNNYLGMVREAQKKAYKKRYSGVDLGEDIIDISQLAAAYGIPSQKVYNLTQAKQAIGDMLSYDGVYLLECYVDSSEDSL